MAEDHAKAAARRRSQRKPTSRRATTTRPRVKRSFRAETAAPQAAKRPARRAPQQTSKKLRRVAGLLAIVAMVAVLVWLFVDSAFYVAQADITGLRYSSAPDIYRQAGVDGYSIFWVNGQETAERLETLPYIKQATVRPALPNRVQIAIEERVPVAVWKAGGRDFWVDVEGITMPVASQVDTLPVLWDLDGSTVAAGGKVDPELIAATRQLREQQPDVSQFGYDRVNGLQFRTPGGTIVYLGKPEGLAQRVRQLEVLQENLAGEGRTPAEINWRVEDAYYIR